MTIDERLKQFEQLANDGMDSKNAVKALKLIGINDYTAEDLKSFRLWGDYMPMGDIDPYTEEQRNLHILWDSIDRVPLGVNCNFAVPFRQIVAKKLFKKCGDGFVANEGCRFNYGHRLEVGDNVSWNTGCYVDSKGGVKFGDFAMMTEYVKIFSHGHSEGDHMIRTYKPVEIGDFAKLYTNCTILPGVRIGKGAIVATGSIVTKNVDEYVLVGGIPAKPMRRREVESADPKIYNQYMMKEKLFQKEK